MANVVMSSAATAGGKIQQSHTQLDPYARLTFGGKKYETKPVDKGGNTVALTEEHKPTHKFPFSASKFKNDAPIELRLDVMDDAPGPDLFIGTTTIDLRKFFSEVVEEQDKGSIRLPKPEGYRAVNVYEPRSGHTRGTAFLTMKLMDAKGTEIDSNHMWEKDAVLEITIHTLEDLKDPNVSSTPTHSKSTLYACLVIFFTYLGVGTLSYCYIGLTKVPLRASYPDGNLILTEGGDQIDNCFKELRALDSLYFVLTTLTTIGYGDFYPCNTAGRVLTFFFIFIGLGAVTTALTIIAEFFMAKSDDTALNAIDQNDQDNISAEEWAVILSVVQYVITLIIGAVFIMRDNDSAGTLSGTMNFADGMYWAMVTSSTVGYGDISASTDAGKVFMYFYMITAILVTGRTIGVIISAALAGKNKRDRLKALAGGVGTKHDLLAIKENSKKMNLFDQNMSEEDQRDKVTKLEYLAYFLMKLGNCDEDNITEILDQFDKIDADGSGTLEADDFAEDSIVD